VEQEAWQVLIVEDDQRLAELTRDYLEANGLRVSVEGDGPGGGADHRRATGPGDPRPDAARRGRPEHLPQGARALRRPILMLTARTDDMDQIQGLDLGADDYVCKPVRPRLLLARIQALLRRSEPRKPVHGKSAACNSARWWWTTPCAKPGCTTGASN
jgi:two-component system response regulator RstA